MARKGHKLTTIKGCVMPEHMIFVDTETTQELRDDGKLYHKLMLGVAIYARFRRDGKKHTKQLLRFKDNNTFWEYVAQKSISKTVLYIISHNAVFDFTVLQHIKYLGKMGYKVQFVYEGGVRFIAKWRKDKHTIMILDNANWFAGKLANWGKELNLPKLDMPKETTDEEKWYVYCTRDVDILYHLAKWYFRFLLDNDLGNWKYTIASSAFTAYRHRFMFHPIYIPNDDDDSQLARESYHGGRTECFRVGSYDTDTYYKLDINSMYPSVMRDYEYPTCFENRYTNPDKKKVYDITSKKAIIADCYLSTNQPYFVCKRNGRNIYPIGQFRTTITTEEFIFAYEMGWVKDIYDVCVYRKREIFREYVDLFYNIKTQAGKEGHRLVRSFAKLYLNSLYGKFGQRGYVDRVIGTDTTDAIRISYGYNARTGERYTLRQIGTEVIYSQREGEGYNSFCAIASHVTANARLMLYDAVLKAGRENCFYCDTDSLIVNTVGLERMKDSLDDVKLGYWKLEGTSNKVEIVAPKHYFFDGHWTMKGIRNDAKNLENNTYEQEIWPGFNTILRQGKEEYYNITMQKKLNPQIISGLVRENGIILPFTLND